MTRVGLLLFVVLTSLTACATSSPTLNDKAQAVEAQVWSPYCPGRLLIDCTTQQARELRADISQRLERGHTTDDVLEWIRSNHGPEALARPDARGAGLAVWLVPLALFAAGALIVARLIRKWARAPVRDL